MKSHLLAAALVGLPVTLAAQGEQRSKFEVYGYAMLDAGYNFDQSDPAWFDVVRPSKLPAFENQFAPDGTTFFSVRQSRLGVRSAVPTDLGDLKTVFEFELFGTGVDAGQTTFRLRHIYGELGRFGAGQTWSPFSDSDVLPNVLDHWGPSGVVSFRNAQVRWMPIQGDTRLTIALERPGASADEGVVADRIELDDVRGRFPVPDLSAEYRHAATWGYVEVAGIVRYIKWEDQGADAFDLSGDATGWGVNLSSNLKLGGQDLARLQVVYGEGIENYMADAPADIGIEANPGNPTAPIRGVAVAGARCGGIRRAQVEREVRLFSRILARGNRQQRAAGARCVRAGPVCARQRPLLPGAGSHDRCRVAVGRSGEFLGRLQLERGPDPVLSQVHFSRTW